MNPIHYLSYLGSQAGIRAVRALPLPAAQRWFGRAAEALFERNGARTRHALANLRIAFPDLSEEQRRAIGRASFRHLAWNAIDFARATAWDNEALMEHLSIGGREDLEAALAQGKGVIALTLHLGNFEFAVRGVSAAGYPLSIVQKARSNPYLDAFVVELRTRTGAEMLEYRRVVPAILRALKRGRIVGFLNDQFARGRRGVLAPFFGVRCPTAAGVATLALRTGTPVVPFFVTRDAPDHHHAVFLPQVEIPSTGDRTADILNGTAICNSVLESIIRKHPEEWMWGHRRFRRSPDLETDLYAE